MQEPPKNSAAKYFFAVGDDLFEYVSGMFVGVVKWNDYFHAEQQIKKLEHELEFWKATKKRMLDNPALNLPIETLQLNVRAHNALYRTGLHTVSDILDTLARGEDSFLAVRNFGEQSLDELMGKLREKGYLDIERVVT